MVKSFKEISWNVTEDEYRADKALSYSTLAKYEREGFNNLDSLFNKVETPSLTFGSAVDAIITGGKEEFEENFIVSDFPDVPDSIVKIVKEAFEKYSDKYNSLSDYPNDVLIRLTEEFSYQLNWKPETRVKVIKEKGSDYYSLLYVAQNKRIISVNTKQQVDAAVDALKTSDSTKFYFAEDNPFDGIERCYQLKWKWKHNGVDYRGMTDLIVVNHNDKTIHICDLKTSSKPEWDFYKSFMEWHYYTQARLYTRGVIETIKNDSYFKDFNVIGFSFIVINKNTLTPLVWKYEDYLSEGELTYKNTVVKDPYDVGKELKSYLDFTPRVPNGITFNSENSLLDFIK